MKPERLVSLDAFRGFTIAGMILVNNPGSWGHIYPQLAHASWHGWTFTDWIFPFFLWIVGVAMTFSFDVRRAKGDSNGTLILKFFLNVSKKEQKRRFLERLTNPEKHWKFEAADLAARAHWGDYMQAYEKMLGATSTAWAPWYVIPADHKWVSRALVANVITSTIKRLNLKYPTPTPEAIKRIKDAKESLSKE